MRATFGRFSRMAVLAALVAAALFPAPGAAQIVELQGGGSSFFNGYGLNANYWGGGYDGWVGAGYQDAWRFGGLVRLRAGTDTVRIGNDVLTLRFPTDQFGFGYNLLVQGVTAQGRRGPLTFTAFGGASATGLGVPFVAARRAEQPFAAIMLRDSVAPRTHIFGTVLASSQQTVAAGAEWTLPTRASAAATIGIGSNRPFGAASAAWFGEVLDLRASFIRAAPGYRRVALPVPEQVRLDGPAAECVWRAREWLALVATRQTFARDSGTEADQARATGTSLVASAQAGVAHAAAGVYLSETVGRRDVSAYVAAGMPFGARLAADGYVLASGLRGGERRITPVVMLHESVFDRLTLDQVITVSGRQTGVSLGGSYAGSLADVGVGYQIVHTPFDRDKPFVRTLTVTLRLNVGDYRASVGTTVLPTGRVHYDASAATFLYLGGENGLQSSAVQSRFDQYVVRGVVVDEAKAPIAGAAIEVGGAVSFTDSQGRFFLRFARRTPLKLVVKLDEFLVRGRYAVVTAPSTVTPDPEARAQSLTVVLRLIPPGTP